MYSEPNYVVLTRVCNKLDIVIICTKKNTENKCLLWKSASDISYSIWATWVVQSAPAECDNFQIAVVTNQVECKGHKNCGETVLKFHVIYAFICYKLHLISGFHGMQCSQLHSDRNLIAISSNARDIRSGCWRREHRAVLSAWRWHSTHSRWISGCIVPRFGDVAWAARSPNLSAPRLLWFGYTLKLKCTRTNLPHLESWKSRSGMNSRPIDKRLMRTVMVNFRSRLQECVASQTDYLRDLTSKK
jgi:hypothetical protein